MRFDDKLAPKGSLKGALHQPHWMHLLHSSSPYGLGNIVAEEEKDRRIQNPKKSAVEQFLLEIAHKQNQRNSNINGHVSMVEGTFHRLSSLSRELQATNGSGRKRMNPLIGPVLIGEP